MKVTEGMIRAFAAGWHSADTGDQAPGARRTAGIAAVLAMPEMEALEVFARAAAAHVVTEGTDEWNGLVDVWNALPQSLVDQLLEAR